MGRISNVELAYMGQAFRIGRYPVHFHLGGDMSSSYIKSSVINRSFNRAVVVHGTDRVLIQDNVVWNIMGGAFFTEDGIEIGKEADQNSVDIRPIYHYVESVWDVGWHAVDIYQGTCLRCWFFFFTSFSLLSLVFYSPNFYSLLFLFLLFSAPFCFYSI